MGAGCGDGGSELLTDVLTLYLGLTIAYYPHCQAKYCPLSPREDFTRIIKPATARTGLARQICAWVLIIKMV